MSPSKISCSTNCKNWTASRRSACSAASVCTKRKLFFGIIHKGGLYFKIDDATVGEYRKRKMKPFRPNARQTLKGYYHVPADIIEDSDPLRVWAMKAIGCQASKQSIRRTR